MSRHPNPYVRIIEEMDKARALLTDDPTGEVEILIATLGDKMVAEAIVPMLRERFPHATFKYVYPGAGVSDTPTPYAVICPIHGRVFMMAEEYHRQMLKPDNRWECPHSGCGMVSSFDDDNYEDALLNRRTP